MADLPGPTVVHTIQYHLQNPELVTVAAQSTIQTGASMLNALISSVVSLFVGFGLGWYVKGRGVTGVKTDLTNVGTVVKTDVAVL